MALERAMAASHAHIQERQEREERELAEALRRSLAPSNPHSTVNPQHLQLSLSDHDNPNHSNHQKLQELQIQLQQMQAQMTLLEQDKESALRGQQDVKEALQALTGLQAWSMSQVRAATNDFHASCRVGGGGFGTVFKCSLPLGAHGAARVVAVKQLARDSMQGQQEFINELKLLSQVQHRNVVKVLGFAAEGSERVIVTPFHQRGSLQAALKSDRKAQLAFSALERIGACQDVANGIAFLHAQQPPIWHLDLKPDNVVREEAARGGCWKLIDFGLSKRIGEIKATQSHISTRTIIGTPGYIAKEFMDAGHMSPACDVYSLGVTLLVVLTGMPAYAEGEHIRDVVSDELGELKNQQGAEPEALLLQSDLVAASCDWTFPGGALLLIELLGLGYACTHPRKSRRPALAAVLQTLRESVDKMHAALTRECLLCLDAPRTTILEPCRHAVACADCAREYCTVNQPCPVCRQPIVSVVSASHPVLQTFVRRL